MTQWHSFPKSGITSGFLSIGFLLFGFVAGDEWKIIMGHHEVSVIRF